MTYSKPTVLRRVTTGLILLQLCVISGMVFADDPPAPSGLPNPVAVSPEDMTAEAADSLKKAKDTENQVTELQELANLQKDMVKLNCLNPHLLSIKQLVNNIELAKVALDDAVKQGNKDDAEHQYAKITAAAEQVAEILVLAEACVGRGGDEIPAPGEAGGATQTVEQPNNPDVYDDVDDVVDDTPGGIDVIDVEDPADEDEPDQEVDPHADT